MNHIRTITAMMVAAIAVFKVGDFSQARTTGSYAVDEESYLSELIQLVVQPPNDDELELFEPNWEESIEEIIDETNNIDTELPQLKSQITTQEPTPSHLILLVLILSPMLWILLSKKKPENPPSEESKLAKAIAEYLANLNKDKEKVEDR